MLSGSVAEQIPAVPVVEEHDHAPPMMLVDQSSDETGG